MLTENTCEVYWKNLDKRPVFHHLYLFCVRSCLRPQTKRRTAPSFKRRNKRVAVLLIVYRQFRSASAARVKINVFFCNK